MRAILGLPLPSGFSNLSTPSTNAIMLNILGGESLEADLELCNRALQTAGANVHLYGKSWRKGRKIGHINIVAGTMKEADAKLQRILGHEAETRFKDDEQRPLVGIIMGSDSDLPVMSVGADILQKFGVPLKLRLFLLIEHQKKCTNMRVKLVHED